jgi:hypothetical protein
VLRDGVGIDGTGHVLRQTPRGAIV